MKGPWRVAREREVTEAGRDVCIDDVFRAAAALRKEKGRKSNGKNEGMMCEKLDKDTGGPPSADSEPACALPRSRTAHAWLVFNGIMLAPARSRFTHNLSETVKNSFDLKGQARKGVCPPRTQAAVTAAAVCIESGCPRRVTCEGALDWSELQSDWLKPLLELFPVLMALPVRSLGTYERRRRVYPLDTNVRFTNV